ncbi:MAG: hypothetical protein H6624_15765 [Bdellovibrionaceae bacterium]|nr:hypothetical protein [Bdellovibrionales bacterium]MCB9085804.1 hypothetical protein [Pseudobdellovibrionaceae bacterium]
MWWHVCSILRILCVIAVLSGCLSQPKEDLEDIISQPGGGSSWDSQSPTLGSSLQFASVQANTLTVSWGASSDNLTSASSLQYRLVVAVDPTDIDTAAEVAAMAYSDPDVMMDWQNALAKNVTGLSASTTYYFAVVVRDSAGNQSLYPPQSVSTIAALACGDVFIPVHATGSTKVSLGAAPSAVTVISDSSQRRSIDLDSECNIFVNTYNAARKYSNSGTLLATSPTLLANKVGPVAVAGNYVIVSKETTIYVLNKSDLTVVGTHSPAYSPMGFHYGSGKLFFTSHSGRYLSRVDFDENSGALSNEVAITLSASAASGWASDITQTRDGSYVISFFNSKKLYKYSLSGTTMTMIWNQSTTNYPTGVIEHPDQNLYTVSDSGVISKFSSAGAESSAVYMSGLGSTWGLVLK